MICFDFYTFYQTSKSLDVKNTIFTGWLHSDSITCIYFFVYTFIMDSSIIKYSYYHTFIKDSFIFYNIDLIKNITIFRKLTVCKEVKYFNPLSPGGDPKDPQLSKAMKYLEQVFKSGQNMFDFSYDDFRKIFDQQF